MDDLANSGNSMQFRALYYLGSLMAQALTEFVDEEGQTPQASWSVSSIDIQSFGQVAERYQQDTIWGIMQFTEQPGGAFMLLTLEGARTLLGLPPDRKVGDDHLGTIDLILNRVNEIYASAWADIADLQPQLGTFPEAPTIADLQEIFMGLSANSPLLCTAFRIAVPAQPMARLILAIPQPYLIPLAQSMEAAAEMTYLNGKDDAVEERLDLLGDCPVLVRATLGTTTMSVAELQNLEEDDVIVLDQMVMAPLTVDLGGARVLAKPGTTTDGLRRAVQVVNLGGD